MTNHLYLIDSSVWIRLFRPQPSLPLRQRIDELLQARRVAVNGLIRLEILVGARGSREFRDFQSTFGRVINFAWGEQQWNKAAELGFRLRRQGLVASVSDLIIAASAIEHDAVLLHADADFDRIAAHAGLKVESYAGLP